MSVVLHFLRYQRPAQHETESVVEAVSLAYRMLQEGTGDPQWIERGDTIAMTRDDLEWDWKRLGLRL